MIAGILRFLSRLRFPQLFVISALLFFVDIVFPDMLPFVDELILGINTLMLASWRKSKDHRPDQAETDVYTVDGEIR